MQSRMVAAVASTNAQRHAPRSVRTLATSDSCRPPTPACGSSNSMRLAPAAIATAGMSSAGDETDDINELACSPDRAKRNPGPPSDAVLPGFAALYPGYDYAKLLLEPVRHAGFLQRRGAGVHPAGQELLVVGGWVGLGVVGPCAGQHRLPLEQRVVMRVLVVAPGAGLLQRLHRAGMHRHYPVLGLPAGREPAGARRGVLVGVIAGDHCLGERIDLVGGLLVVHHENRIGIVAELNRLVGGDAGAAGGDVREEEASDLLDALPAFLVVMVQRRP